MFTATIIIIIKWEKKVKEIKAPGEWGPSEDYFWIILERSKKHLVFSGWAEPDHKPDIGQRIHLNYLHYNWG